MYIIKPLTGCEYKWKKIILFGATLDVKHFSLNKLRIFKIFCIWNRFQIESIQKPAYCDLWVDIHYTAEWLNKTNLFVFIYLLVGILIYFIYYQTIDFFYYLLLHRSFISAWVTYSHTRQERFCSHVKAAS